MWTGIQWSGDIGAGATHTWYTHSWPVDWHVVWYVMPTSPLVGAAQLEWDVAVERADADHCTYWITIKNLTSSTVTLEGRYAVLSTGG